MGSDNSKMEEITNNPGLQHIAEKIFSYLSLIDLHQCLLADKSWSEVIDRNFLLKKCVEVGMVKKHGKKLILNEERVLQPLACYEIITANRVPLHWAVMKGLTEVVKILAPLSTTSLNQKIQFIDNDYVRLGCDFSCYCYCDYESSTFGNPIEIAAEIGLIEIVETLANLNPDQDFTTAIVRATGRGHLEIIKILAPLISSLYEYEKPQLILMISLLPNYLARKTVYTDIIKVLAPKLGCYHCMEICDCSYSCYCPPRINGHRDIVKLLAPYSCHDHR